MMVNPNQTEQGVVAGKQLNLLQVFGICLVAAAVLFLGYEIVERTWLTDIDPKILYNLHILRGLAAAAIAAAMTTIILLRQIDARPGEVSLSSGRWTLRRPLQNASLRTKIMVPMVALAAAPAITIGIFVISQTQESLWKTEVQRIEFDTVAKANVMQEFLQGVQEDLLFLAQSKVIREFADEIGRAH